MPRARPKYVKTGAAEYERLEDETKAFGARARINSAAEEEDQTGLAIDAHRRRTGSRIDVSIDGRLEGLSGGTSVLRMADDGALEEIELDNEGSQRGKKSRRKKGRKSLDAEEEVTLEEVAAKTRREALADYDRLHMNAEADAEIAEDGDGELTLRTHPLTLANRFGTMPTTLQLPKDAFVEPATLLLSGLPNPHLASVAHRIFGGVGLPYSTSTPAKGKTMQQKPIALDAAQERMSDIDADVYLGVLMPGMLASITSILVETRKRLGTAWAESLVAKAEAGELRILDAGGGGAGVLAVRELLRAEWERMHEEASEHVDSPMALAEADGKLGGASASPPLGQATVLTGSDTLRKRASQLLDNTSFIPRLPDYVHTQTESARQEGKFDIIVAPHTLWPLREDYMRKVHVQNLWSLLRNDGGVMLLLEKGIARGFELVAAARNMLLDTRISSPESREQSLDIADPREPEIEWDSPRTAEEQAESLTRVKEKGMIIAPCTNHTGCPMYLPKGRVKGRKDICHFEQRYVRPSFLQKVLGARDKNWEDVKFSYVSVMRGRDLREADNEHAEPEVVQGKGASDRAFDAHPDHLSANQEPPTHSLNLPRSVLAPLKRRGHVILDLCTPSGVLERWTVPRSYSKQAFRDARKSSWGDLWALGAKTRVRRDVRKTRYEKEEGAEQGEKMVADVDVKLQTRGKKKKAKAERERKERAGRKGKGRVGEGVGVDEYGRLIEVE
ncbi:hypothetical protein BAUCODRAFT_32143 [Baudoinia panamericana UAMH 10762]|uniref:37S ribosomal protein S22 n=1 Tax=Baudoinia panamericana (strain UAMH 10762) TaxID=717646 RepID=M2NFU9_BAUPA|nr:uncharacterized protein BAUCODRAFT_32143 [Baudoinia panamericana UAMH 10762]EMC98144.1 hypothetical protein BAUCODRAFT_32143 [Baudoinia panamericana UAMH 10762]